MHASKNSRPGQMTRRPRWIRGTVATTAALGLVLMGPTAAIAAGDDTTQPRDQIGLGALLETLTAPLAPVLEGLAGAAQGAGGTGSTAPDGASKAGSAATDDGDSEGHETPDPTGDDHASTQGVAAEVADNELAQVGGTSASVGNDNSTESQATVLALGGQTIIGAEADSRGTKEAQAGDPLAPVCDASGGALCAALLFAEASASEDGPGSRSSSSIGLARACLGGETPTGADCDGPVQAGVAESSSEITRNKGGHTIAKATTSVADVCLVPGAAGEGCAVGIEALSTTTTSNSKTGESTRTSKIAGLTLAGNEVLTLEDPIGISVPPGCTSPALLCAFLNQGETHSGPGTNRSAAQEALHVLLLDGTVDALVGQAETKVHQGPVDTDTDGGDDNDGGDNDGGDNNPGGNNNGGGDGNGNGGGDGSGAQAGGSYDDGVLPNTGGVWSGLLSLGLLGLALGSFLVAWSRRTSLVDAS
ncbi:hypothetical protein [Nocardioides pacificus]